MDASSTLGPRHELVVQFLDEVRHRDTDWQALAGTTKSPEASAAMAAIADLRWPAAQAAAVDDAALQAFSSLGLTRDMFDHPLAMGRIKNSIGAASTAISAGDALGREHVEALLKPYVAAGFPSAQRALATTSGQDA
ncbi:hypothetical protein [Cellulomonas sp.]|uniref:hypothetical protein n=1 Tax=Cellulomonas sp. TaxID=40001 RepID=UPI001B03B928|nr:hypothetical protein [Cellulomonas sp.]MBO9554926.1 hypothetical protein [Cellulomonas sp.]